MPIALIIIGLFLAIAGIKNNAATLGQTVGEDFRGAGSFWYWIVAVLVVGSIGYASDARGISRLFLTLIVLVFVLTNEGIYAQLVRALQNPTPAPSNDGKVVEKKDGGAPGAAKEGGGDSAPSVDMMELLFNPNPTSWLGAFGGLIP
jgi:hypothetical protein